MAMAFGSRWPISSIHWFSCAITAGCTIALSSLTRGGGRRAAKRGFGQPRTVDASVGIQNFAAKAADDFLIDRAPGLHEPVRDGIGLDEMSSEFDKHLADDGFAARDAAGEAEF